MWGQNWGQMIWGHAGRPVPALGFWGAMLLGAALGIIAVRCLRGRRPRVAASIIILGAAILIPISARAVSLVTFTNGTIADADQVNANFANLNPLQGYNEMVSSANTGTILDVTSPTAFVAPRNLICTVTAESDIFGPPSTGATGFARFSIFALENGTMTFTGGPPQNGLKQTGYSFTVGGGNEWTAVQTVQFSILFGTTTAFGCHTTASGDFSASNNGFCAIVYNCV